MLIYALTVLTLLAFSLPSFGQYMEVSDKRNNNNTYSMGIIKDYGPKTLEKMRYLKFPRSGVTFAATVLRYSCDHTDETRPFDLIGRKYVWHDDQSCKKRIIGINSFFTAAPLKYEDSVHAVAMFRRPVDRFASQLRWMRSMVGFVRTYGVANEDVDLLMNQLSLVQKRGDQTALMNSSNPCGKHVKSLTDMRACRYRIASHFPGLRGCMTKMVLGRQCAERYKLTIADLLEAKRIVREDFKFVGIAESWDESVRLFHGLHGGRMYADEIFARYRDSPKAIENVRKALANSYDYFDEELYRTALSVFDRQRADLLLKVRSSKVDIF